MPMSTRKPLPLSPQPVRKRCSICGSESYSQSGVHPQCAAKQAGDEQRAKDKAQEVATPKPARPMWSQRNWHK